MMSELPLFERARRHGDSEAFRDGTDQRTYSELLDRSGEFASLLLDGEPDLEEARVAFLIPAGFEYAFVQWGIWRAGGIAVPLSLSATESELEYTLRDSRATVFVSTPALAGRIEPLRARLGLRYLSMSEEIDEGERTLPTVESSRRAMILYTSGTTSKPKGVVTTHSNIQAQIEALVEAWRWESSDRIPLFLPLHHIHGIINVMSCALWSGATIEPFDRFDIDRVLGRVREGAYSVFMAVPTIYVKLIRHLESLEEAERIPILEQFSKMRLMVSGSAALPASVHERWQTLTSQPLLERYGMTEIGMALSNPYEGERRPGTVGQPLPGVELRLVSELGGDVTTTGDPGEIQVRGPCVFGEYWDRPQATSEAFSDGWFRTGDMAVVEDGYFRIMGRLSVDIIKSGGYKLSALEIESVLQEHPSIGECAVVGLPDDTWGEVVAVASVLVDDEVLSLEELQSWCSERVSSYKVPRRFLVVEGLPRNAMGKVTKPAVRELFTESD